MAPMRTGNSCGPMAPIRTLRAGCERGAELVEFALVLPLLLVLIGGIIDFGFLFQRYEVVTNAAREGARLASLPGFNTSPYTAVDTRVRDYVRVGLALPSNPTNAVMTVAVTPGTVTGITPAVQTMVVNVTYRHNFIMLGPIMSLINATWSNQINVNASSQMRLEVPAAAGS